MCLAVPGMLVSVTEGSPLERVGRVDFGGVIKEINLAFVPEATLGDYVLVHVGVAIGTINASEARRVFDYLREIGDMPEMQDSSP